MTSYRSSPHRQGALPVILSVILLISALLSFFFSRYLGGNLRIVGQGLSVVLLVLFVQFSSRFCLTAYSYLLEEGTLSLSSRTGRRIKNLGSLPVTAECLLYKKEEWQKKKGEYPLSHRFSFCQNPFPKNYAVLLLPDREKEGFIQLKFEPDETLFTLLKEKIKKEAE